MSKHGNPTLFFSNFIDPKTVPDESANVHARKRMYLGSNYVVTKSPNFMDFTDGSGWLVYRHDIDEVTV